MKCQVPLWFLHLFLKLTVVSALIMWEMSPQGSDLAGHLSLQSKTEAVEMQQPGGKRVSFRVHWNLIFYMGALFRPFPWITPCEGKAMDAALKYHSQNRRGNLCRTGSCTRRMFFAAVSEEMCKETPVARKGEEGTLFSQQIFSSPLMWNPVCPS